MRALLIALPLALFALVSRAEPWIGPGDVRLRHDLQRLADAGLLSGPTLSWPIGWSQVARELGLIDLQRLDSGERIAVVRLRARAAREMRTGQIAFEAEIAGSANPTPLRSFDDIPREEGEASLAATWVGQRFAWKLAGTVVADPEDGQEFRADGTYIAASLGNWMLSAGYLDRWWGPGWQGSLILSSNMRPMLTIALDRNEPVPFDLPVLRWLGPWRLSTFMSQFEHDRDYPYALLFGLRAEIRPHPTLQLAASRTAQWCGEGRPCGFDTFWDLLIGNDNDQAPDQQPGNQLAGFDIRWSWPGARVPVALYAQGIGEDEAGFLPSKYLGLFGAETWGDVADGSWRLHVEYADTACDFLADPPEFGCAYTNSIYTTGYRYLGHVLGHTIDADSESIGGGVLFLDRRGWRWEALVRNIKLNRAGAAVGDTLADAPARVRDIGLVHESEHSWGTISVSLGYADVDASGAVAVEDGWRGFLSWRHEVR
jgi:hypothetical protein